MTFGRGCTAGCGVGEVASQKRWTGQSTYGCFGCGALYCHACGIAGAGRCGRCGGALDADRHWGEFIRGGHDWRSGLSNYEEGLTSALSSWEILASVDLGDLPELEATLARLYADETFWTEAMRFEVHRRLGVFDDLVFVGSNGDSWQRVGPELANGVMRAVQWHLERHGADSDALDARELVSGLVKLGPRPRVLVEAATMALDPSSKVRAGAVDALQGAGFGGHDAPFSLDPIRPLYLSAIRDADRERRRQGLAFLLALRGRALDTADGTLDAAALDTILDVLPRAEPSTLEELVACWSRGSIFDALDMLALVPAFVPLILERLGSENRREVRDAIDWCARLGPAAAAAKPRLEELLQIAKLSRPAQHALDALTKQEERRPRLPAVFAASDDDDAGLVRFLLENEERFYSGVDWDESEAGRLRLDRLMRAADALQVLAKTEIARGSARTLGRSYLRVASLADVRAVTDPLLERRADRSGHPWDRASLVATIGLAAVNGSEPAVAALVDVFTDEAELGEVRIAAARTLDAIPSARQHGDRLAASVGDGRALVRAWAILLGGPDTARHGSHDQSPLVRFVAAHRAELV